MSQVDIAVEKFTDALFAEMLPLGRKCFEESTTVKGEACAYYGSRDFPIEPDIEQYRHLAQLGSLVIVTLREAGVLRGFVVGFMHRCMHHKHVIGAVGDTLYVEPEQRAYTGVLIERFLEQARAMKAEIVGWPTTIDGYVYNVLKAMNFVGDDIVMERRLCV